MSPLLAGLLLVGGLAALVTLPGTLELLALTLAGLLPARRPGRPVGLAPGLLAVVVPAHDEEAGIGRTVASLRACRGADAIRVVVVADNCSDATAVRARAAGARVLERVDPERRGKGFALDLAFRTLLPEGFTAFLVVDADSVADPGLVEETRAWLAAGADAVQARYGVLNPGASLRTRLMNAALCAFNVLRPRGRERLGLSAGILGNGFALSRATLEAHPYEARSIVEDVEYHLTLLRAGRRVRFAAAAVVLGEMPTGGAGAASQRARWEGGRLRMAREAAPALLRDLLRGRLRLLEPLLDLLLLPLAFHVALLLLALLAAGPVRVYALAALGVVALHVVAALAVGGGGPRDLLALLAAPFYVLWKLALSGRILGAARREAAWVRTAREPRREDLP